MKDIIRKILKEENLKQNLKQQMKDYGWEDAAELVGGPENFVSIMGYNDPIEFLNEFNDLDVVQSKKEKYWTLFRYEPKNNIIVYVKKNGIVYISYNYIQSFLEKGFGLNYLEIEKLIERWLSESYNLRGIKNIFTTTFINLTVV